MQYLQELEGKRLLGLTLSVLGHFIPPPPFLAGISQLASIVHFLLRKKKPYLERLAPGSDSLENLRVC